MKHRLREYRQVILVLFIEVELIQYLQLMETGRIIATFFRHIYKHRNILL